MVEGTLRHAGSLENLVQAHGAEALSRDNDPGGIEDMLADVVRGISHGLYLTLKLDRSSTIIGQVDDDS
ncbi:hypothetical protein GCM10009080_53410 [Cupriavidus pauculus]|jgi:hypothetical protein